MARVTLADVAKAAGVGVATASRALSPKDHSDVSAATRQRLREVADELGYRPSLAARAFRSRGFRAVSIVVPDGQWGWWVPAVRAAHAAARAQGVTAFVQPTAAARRDSGDVVDVIAGLAEVPTEGVLILGPAGAAQMLATARSLRLPVVAIDNAADEVLVPALGVDNRLGVRLGVQHLLAQGRRRIAYVGTGGDLPFHHARREGYRDALAEAGIDVDPALMLEDPVADIAATPYLPAVEELLAAGTAVDAVLVESDGGAAPVLRSLRRAGRSVPEDVAVVGFDDSAVAVALDPPLTSVRQPFEQLGAEAMELLLGIVGGAEAPVGRRVLAPSLVVRDSTGPAPDSASATGERAPLRLVVGGASREELHTRLAKLGIQLNDGARTLLEDPCFDTRAPETLEVVQRSLHQLGLASGGTLPQITAAARAQGLAPLPPDTGPYLRLAITDQGQAPDSILSAGRAPTGAVHVHSAPLRPYHDYPKGFYLRVVDGVTWLRGFRCDDEYVWPADAVLALRGLDE